MISDEEIDKAILSVIPKNNQKVAMSIVKVEELIGGRADKDAFFSRIAERIEFLASRGSLIGYGNLKNWRQSEVRLPDDQ